MPGGGRTTQREDEGFHHRRDAPVTVYEADVLYRLALWLADVSAEAALAADASIAPRSVRSRAPTLRKSRS